MSNKIYPDFFPKDIHIKITEAGAKENKLTVYRICNSGIINRDAFLSTYEEKTKNNTYNRDIYYTNEYDIGDYSTSCFEVFKDINKLLGCMKKYYHGPIIIEGEINPSYGLSLRAKDSIIKESKKSHVHWWIYKNCNPSDDFKKHIAEDELQ